MGTPGLCLVCPFSIHPWLWSSPGPLLCCAPVLHHSASWPLAAHDADDADDADVTTASSPALAQQRRHFPSCRLTCGPTDGGSPERPASILLFIRMALAPPPSAPLRPTHRGVFNTQPTLRRRRHWGCGSSPGRILHVWMRQRAHRGRSERRSEQDAPREPVVVWTGRRVWVTRGKTRILSGCSPCYSISTKGCHAFMFRAVDARVIARARRDKRGRRPDLLLFFLNISLLCCEQLSQMESTDAPNPFCERLCSK